mmetsp:Transcript_54028/g.112883  ORF Transcript_54028/g.112883 Transcript_54028/m.112883 type:complete len:283 (-) Transcript_54028:203-1051(-)
MSSAAWSAPSKSLELMPCSSMGQRASTRAGFCARYSAPSSSNVAVSAKLSAWGPSLWRMLVSTPAACARKPSRARTSTRTSGRQRVSLRARACSCCRRSPNFCGEHSRCTTSRWAQLGSHHSCSSASSSASASLPPWCAASMYCPSSHLRYSRGFSKCAYATSCAPGDPLRLALTAHRTASWVSPAARSPPASVIWEAGGIASGDHCSIAGPKVPEPSFGISSCTAHVSIAMSPRGMAMRATDAAAHASPCLASTRAAGRASGGMARAQRAAMRSRRHMAAE